MNPYLRWYVAGILAGLGGAAFFTGCVLSDVRFFGLGVIFIGASWRIPTPKWPSVN